jgi:flagellar hook-basal body complex protein FliE
MSTVIGPIAPVESTALRGSERPGARSVAGTGFGDLLSDAVTEAHARERVASESAVGFANGDPAIGIHEVMIASEEANVTLRYAATLKNKVLDAYRELMSTAV